MLCLWVIIPEMLYNVILHCSEMSPWAPLLKWQNMSVQLYHQNDNGSEVCSPVESLRRIRKYYSMSHSLYYLSIHLAQAQVEGLLNWNDW